MPLRLRCQRKNLLDNQVSIGNTQGAHRGDKAQYDAPMQTNLSCTVCTALVAALAFAGCSTSSSSSGPTILDVTPSVTNNSDGTFTVDLIVDFDDSVDTGDLVDAYTFQTSDGQVDDVDVPLSQPSASPFTIAGLILPADESGQASLGFHLALYGASTGLGSTFTGSINVN